MRSATQKRTELDTQDDSVSKLAINVSCIVVCVFRFVLCLLQIEEIDTFPSEWVTIATRPCQSPYLPQVGDVVSWEKLLSSSSWLMWSLFQVVYWHQGHKIYCKAVLENKVYPLGDEWKPWEKYNLKVSIYCCHLFPCSHSLLAIFFYYSASRDL